GGGGPGGGAALPPPPWSLEEWHVKGLEEEDEGDPLEALAQAEAGDGGDDGRDVGGGACGVLGTAVWEGGEEEGEGEEGGGEVAQVTPPPMDTVPRLHQPPPADTGLPLDAATAAAAAALTAAAAPQGTTDTTGAAGTYTSSEADHPITGAASVPQPTTCNERQPHITPHHLPQPPPQPPDEDAARVRQQQQQRLRSYWLRPVVQWDPYERLLLAGALVVWGLRGAVRRELGYTCSAG
ncbi:hypothetical protein Agub_g5057, partial [Astrephomene gubernaculifera]